VSALTERQREGLRSRWPARTLEERLLEKIAVDVETGCWLWTAYTDPAGYGRIATSAQPNPELAHRVSYRLYVGPIPEGLTLDHLCRVRRCVNPAHLEPVTLAENKRRGESLAAQNARKTHCPQGHPYDEANTHVTAQGYRDCRACNRERHRREAAATFAARPERHCAAPGCTAVIPREARSHKLTCSPRCRTAYYRSRTAS
jgi:hypothetical protein